MDEILGNGVSLEQLEQMENILFELKDNIEEFEIQDRINNRNYPRW